MFGLLFFLNFVFQKLDNHISNQIDSLEDRYRDVVSIKKVAKSLVLDFTPTPQERSKLEILDVVEELSKRFDVSMLEDFRITNEKVLSIKIGLKSNNLKRDELYYLFSLLNRQDLFFLLEKLSIDKGENGSNLDAVLEIKSIVE